MRYTTPPAIKISTVQLQCDSCGAETHAACSCGVVYRPKSERAVAAVAAHPEKSNVAIAEEIGASEATVRRAREMQPRHHDEVEGPRIGRDGRTRQLPTKPPATAKEGYVVSAGKATAADYHTADRVRNVLEYLVSEFDPLDLSRALCGCRDAKEIDRINRALERASKHLDDVRAAMGQCAVVHEVPGHEIPGRRR